MSGDFFCSVEWQKLFGIVHTLFCYLYKNSQIKQLNHFFVLWHCFFIEWY